MASTDKTEKNGLEPKNKEKRQKRNPFVMAGGIIILVILVITFVAGPAIGSIGSGYSNFVYGSYNGKTIEVREDNYMASQVESVAAQMQNNQATDAISQQFQLYQVWRSAFENTVVHMAFLDMAEQAKYLVTSNKIDETIINNGPYTDADGKFDEDRYLATSNTRRKTLKDNLTENVIQNNIVRDIFSSKISTGEVDFIKSMGADEYKIRYAVFSYADFPSDKIIAFANDQEDLFREVTLSRIAIFGEEESAVAVADQLKENPLLFEELARNNSQDSYAEKGGVMGTFAYHELDPFFDDSGDLDAVFNLAMGVISDVVVNENGFYIYRMDAPASTPDFASTPVQESILAYMDRFEKGQIEDYFLAQADEVRAAASEESLTIAARDMAEIHETEGFPLVYGSPSFALYDMNYPLFKAISVADGDTTLQSTSRDMPFLKAVAGLKNPGDLSDPLILDQGVVILELAEMISVTDDDLASTEFYYNYAVSSWKQNALQQRILASDLLDDNFYDVFGRNMSGN